ncbi:MAG: PAS domain S-box protein [Sphingobacteriia bacterium]|nr:PAS domain S-box protein [Sphingobacteriia bacterium]
MENATSLVNRLIQEDSFRLMSKASIVSITDTKGTILFANDHFANISGYTIDELVGKSHNIINSGYHPRHFWADMWNAVLAGKNWREEVKNKRKDGTFYWVDVQIMPHFGDDGKVNAIISVRNDITKRKTAENEKVELGNRLNIFTEHIPGFLYQYQLRPDGTSFFPYASKGIINIYGLHPGDVLHDAAKVFEVIHPDDRPKVISTILYSAEHLTEWRWEYRVILPSGPTIWVAGFSSPELLEDGSILWHGFLNNITERKLAAEKFESANAQLEALIEALPDAIFFKDGEGRWVVTNNAAKKLFNLEGYDWLGKTEREMAIDRPAYREAHEKCMIDDAQAWNQRKLSVFTEFIKEEQEALREFEVRKIPLFNPDGSRKGLVIVGSDITERRRAEEIRKQLAEELNISKQRYESLFSQNHESVFSVDLNGKFTSANERFLKATGHSLEELLQMYYTSIIHPDDMAKVNESFERAKQGISTRFESRVLICKKTEIKYIYQVNMPMVVNRKIVGVYILASNITERVMAEEKIKKQNQQLREIARIQSHEVRAPLANIIGLANLFDKNNAGDPNNEMILKELTVSAKKLDGVIHKIVDKVYAIGEIRDIY